MATSFVHYSIDTSIPEEHFPKMLVLLRSSCPIEVLTLEEEGESHHGFNEADALLKVLAKSDVIDGSTQWLLPRLRHLEITQYSRMRPDLLVRMVRNRYKDREPRLTRQLPVMLESLKIEGINRFETSQLEELKSILGPSAVHYEHLNVEEEFSDEQD